MFDPKAWNKKTKDEKRALLEHLLDRGEAMVPDFIDLVRTSEVEGVYGSGGPNFQYAIFGRDSIKVASDLLATHQQLAYDIIHELSRLQGVRVNPKSEEEPGKIHHEYRYAFFGGKRVLEPAETVLRNLQQKYGGYPGDVMIYYGSYDATPLFVRLVGQYVDKYGQAILKQTYLGRDGKLHNIEYSLTQAVKWVANKVQGSAWGLLEYKRTDPNKAANQSWKDSETGCLFADGSLPNFEGGLAGIELQGYAYDALLVGSKLMPQATLRRHCQTLAENILNQIVPRFWMADSGYFGQAIDRDSTGKTRIVNTLTSNPALLLDSNVLLDMPPKVATTFVNSIVKTIMGPDFLTTAGVRSRAWRHHAVPGFTDYHGSYTVWPKETHDIAKGLRRHGFTQQAEELENRLLKTVAAAGEFYEYFYVGENGAVWYDPKNALATLNPDSSKIDDSALNNHPEPCQAWTISAFMDCLEKLWQENPKHSSDANKPRDLPKTLPTASPAPGAAVL